MCVHTYMYIYISVFILHTFVQALCSFFLLKIAIQNFLDLLDTTFQFIRRFLRNESIMDQVYNTYIRRLSE